MGISVAVGMAIADKEHFVYVVTSDGECAEGVVWESLRIAGEQRLENLRIAVVANGFSAMGRVDVDLLDTRMQMFYPSMVVKTDLFKFPSWIAGLSGHYVTIENEDMYKEILSS